VACPRVLLVGNDCCFNTLGISEPNRGWDRCGSRNNLRRDAPPPRTRPVFPLWRSLRWGGDAPGIRCPAYLPGPCSTTIPSCPASRAAALVHVAGPLSGVDMVHEFLRFGARQGSGHRPQTRIQPLLGGRLLPGPWRTRSLRVRMIGDAYTGTIHLLRSIQPKGAWTRK